MNSIAESIEKRIRSSLSAKRLRHIDGVASVASSLAERFGVDPAACRVAALAHDMFRELPKNEMVRRAVELSLPLSDHERRNPAMLHGPLAAHELEAGYAVGNTDLVDAVRHHTLGHPSLGPVGWVLFVSDYAEPGRKHLSREERERILSAETLPRMVCSVVEHSRTRFASLENPTEAMFRRLCTKDVSDEAS